MGQLYFSVDGGDLQPLGEVPDLTFEPDNIEEVEPTIRDLSEATFECSLTSHRNKFGLFELFTGVKLTNNYLKMNGGVIQRHKTIDRYLREHKERKNCLN